MSLVRAVATVGGYTMASRILGFVRDILIAALAGAGPVADAFFVAFKLPNFFRALFAEGAFNAAFVPLYSEAFTKQGRARALAFAGEALAILLIALFAFTVLAQVFMPAVMLVLAPGFVANPAKFDLAVVFTRITFPYLLFISLVSLFGGVLNAMGRFAAVAATPIMLNLTMIAAVLVLAPLLPSPGHALAWGVLLAGLTQFFWLLAACLRAGWMPRLPWPRLTPDVKRLLRLIAPAALGAGVVQINLVVGTVLASLLPSGAISYLFYADRLNQLPIGVIGVAIGTALLPLLSHQISAGRVEEAMASQNRAVELALLFGLPATAAFLTVPHEIIAILFERGAFTAQATAATAATLMGYSVGLPAYVLVRSFQPGFYARQDTRTPLRIALVCIVVNIGLSLVLMQRLGHVGLALATAAASWTNVALLAVILWRRGQWRIDPRLRRVAPRILLSTLVMAAVLLGLAWAVADWVQAAGARRPAALAILVAGGLVAYGVTVQILGAARLDEVRAALRRRRN